MEGLRAKGGGEEVQWQRSRKRKSVGWVQPKECRLEPCEPTKCPRRTCGFPRVPGKIARKTDRRRKLESTFGKHAYRRDCRARKIRRARGWQRWRPHQRARHVAPTKPGRRRWV